MVQEQPSCVITSNGQFREAEVHGKVDLETYSEYQ